MVTKTPIFLFMEHKIYQLTYYLEWFSLFVSFSLGEKRYKEKKMALYNTLGFVMDNNAKRKKHHLLWICPAGTMVQQAVKE